MVKIIHNSSVLLFLCLTLIERAKNQELQEMKRPYFCSTCFTTTQDQNYHCCFYFFKCCAEARLGSRTTTPNPSNPGLPSGMTFFVQNRNARPCSVDCKDVKQASNLCCRLENSKNKQNSRLREADDVVFKPAFNIQVMEADEVETTESSSARIQNVSEFQTAVPSEKENKTKYQNLGIEITGSPVKQNLRHISSERRIFYSPSLIFDRETEGDAIRDEQNWKKHGWYTKDILNLEINNQKSMG